eukprot:TRINITY_DN38382_c0_g1_i1.p1 TRINITY_DN38382_c0_g1~~TRINITY_DN38382_c0_g1_i1.p1  ORF type:complete len:191 (+),score=43.00 TRINITY_DN38382_c0_g1_i1:138-710(+)
MAALQSSMLSLRLEGCTRSSLFGSCDGLARPGSAQPFRSQEGGPLSVRMAVKRWEKKELTDAGLPVRHKLHVKKGDTVQLICGHEKGKVTEVLRVFTHNSTILCKDVNVKTKHEKPRAKGESGQIKQMEAPIHSSNVMAYSKQQQVRSRIGHKLLENGSKVRYLLKTGEVIDDLEGEKASWRNESLAAVK